MAENKDVISGYATEEQASQPGQTTFSFDFDPFAELGEEGPLGVDQGFLGYSKWLPSQQMELIDAQLHAERLFKWNEKPRFLIVVILRHSEGFLLSRSVADLQKQLYTDWKLLVISESSAPPELVNNGLETFILWQAVPSATSNEYLHAALRNTIEAINFDWITLLPPGFMLKHNALLVMGDYISANQAWLAFYTDDDRVDLEGRHFHPRLKPAFDIDFLRGFDYASPGIWIKREGLLALDGFAELGDGAPFEFMLRLWETAGDGCLGHIPKVLVHLPVEAGSFDVDSTVRDVAVLAHFERAGLKAEAKRGLFPGTRFIAWSQQTEASVCIIIPTRDKTEYLIPCVESILSKTAYQNYSILIVDNATQDPDLLEWLTKCEKDSGGKVSCLKYPYEFNYSAMGNLAAEASSADLLCFLDNDTEIIQPSWLASIASLAVRADVGAVGPRLVRPESGQIQNSGLVLGLEPMGVASSPHADLLGINDPGPLNRLQVTRSCSAISSSCLIIRKSVFASVGGFDEEELSVMFADVDLCLNIGEKGLRNLWTPNATLVHYGAVSFVADSLMPSSRSQWLPQIKADREVMYRRWRRKLSNDPWYNRNLSLRDGSFRLDTELRTTWDQNFSDRRRVLGIPLPGGAGNYRVRDPLDALADSGRLQTRHLSIENGGFPLPSVAELARIAPDTVLLHSGLDDACLSFLESKRFNPDMLWVYALDDLVTQVPRKSSAWRTFKSVFRDAKPRLRAALSLSDRLIVSTQPLSDLCAPIIKDVVVVPNRLADNWRGLESRRNTTSKIRVGWVGAIQHQGDLELIEPVVKALHEEVDFVFMGMVTDAMRPFITQFERPVPWEKYPAKLASLNLDVALAPLEIVPFNECKSNLRLLEYGVVGWPVVCTDIYPYQQDNAPVTRVTNEPEAWVEAIRALARDPERRAREGDELRNWVLSRYMLSDHLEQWERALLR